MPVECELVGDDDQDVAVVRAALDLLGLIFLVDAMLESIQNAYASPSACNQDRYASTSDLGGTFPALRAHFARRDLSMVSRWTNSVTSILQRLPSMITSQSGGGLSFWPGSEVHRL